MRTLASINLAAFVVLAGCVATLPPESSTASAPVVYAAGADGADAVRVLGDGSSFRAQLMSVPGATVTYDELFTLTNRDTRAHEVVLGGDASGLAVSFSNGATIGAPFTLAPGETIGARVSVSDAGAALALTTSVS